MASLLSTKAPQARIVISRLTQTASRTTSQQCLYQSTRSFITTSPARPHLFSRFQPQQALSRAFSSTRRSPAAAATNVPHTASNLPWNTFFRIRKTRRTLGFVAGIAGAATAVIVGTPMIGQYDVDTKIGELVGIDSVYALAAASILVALGGYMGGRAIAGLSSGVILTARGWSKAFTEKENSLLHRVKRYRADPSNSSPQNPIPDYYGEKIKNVAGYRQWLKDQKIYQRKMYRDKVAEQ